MSRLDSFIRRMKAQRACLDWAAQAIADLPGPVFELGLGNGRTYDHLREILPSRDIYVFEQVIKAHPNCIPPDDRLFLGDAIEQLPVARDRLGRISRK
ncbi:MAG: class I SAM-dependent methyltransferase [Pseudomonadota bacterium]